jgi:hypothetical protein
VPVNRLPPEILALIPTFRESERDLLSATTVCEYWRRTLISTPNLWTKIVYPRGANPQVVPPRVQAYLERSESVPIHVRIRAHASQFLSSHTGRISSLEMFLDHPSNLDDIAQHLSKPAPILETINLRVGEMDQPTLALPPTFFEAFLSSARELTLHGATLSPGPCKLSWLTKFTLTTHFFAGVPSVVLLDTLERMPLLRFFEVTFYSISEPDPVSRSRMVTLSHLEEIIITTDLSPFAQLTTPILPVLCLPSARRVRVQMLTSIPIPPNTRPYHFHSRSGFRV